MNLVPSVQRHLEAHLFLAAFHSVHLDLLPRSEHLEYARAASHRFARRYLEWRASLGQWAEAGIGFG
jgi:hypothetical protein